MTFTVDLERDREGWWVAAVREVPGCRTQGRSIRQTMARVREALCACEEDGTACELITVTHLPREARHALVRLEASRARLEHEQSEIKEAADRAVTVLTKDLKMSVRDAAALLGFSHQRVDQIGRGA